MRVGLLICGHVDERALDVAGDYPELFEGLFDPLGVELAIHRVNEGAFPASIHDCDGWITSPSRRSAFDDEDWIRETTAFVRELVEHEKPFAGICFGHQLIATAMGGRVERAAAGWGVGAREYSVVARRPWMEPFPDDATIRLIASHQDQVTELPPGAELLATADYCPNAMYALGERAFGLQPHPEFTAPLAARLLDLRQQMIGPDVVAAARATLGRPLDGELLARWIVNFLRG